MRERRRRLLVYALLIGSAVLMVNAVIGDKGYLATLQAKREHEAITAALGRLHTENRQLQEQAQRLKNDPAAIEEAARRQLGLIRPGETLVIIREAKPGKPPTGGR